MFCVWTEPCVATSYGDDHHHCWPVVVFTRLIEDGVVLDELLGVNPFVHRPAVRKGLFRSVGVIRHRHFAILHRTHLPSAISPVSTIRSVKCSNPIEERMDGT